MLSQVNDDKEKGVSVGTKSVSEQLVEVVPGGEGAAARGGQRRGLGCLRNRGGSAAAALWLISSGGKLSGFLQRLSTLAGVEE
jgi:hypothetical protein